MDLAKPRCRLKETQIGNKIQRWLSSSVFLEDLIHWKLDSQNGRWHLQFDFNHVAFQKLLTRRLGRTVLLTNRIDWTAEQIVAGYSGQQQIEQVFRGLKDGDWLGWGPMYHWTDSKIRIHAFYCMLGVSLAEVHPQTSAVGMAGALHGAIAPGAAADPAVRSPLSTPRGEGTAARCDRAVQTNFPSTRVG
jgi:hypothetical protein